MVHITALGALRPQASQKRHSSYVMGPPLSWAHGQQHGMRN